MRTCKTQQEAQSALDAGESVELVAGIDFRLTVSGTFAKTIRVLAGATLALVARESSQPHVEAWESSQPHIEAWGSSQPHIVAWGSSQPHIVAWGSSQPHIEAWESSQPHIVARGSSQPHIVARGSSQPHIVAWESSQPHIEATGYVQMSLTGKVIGTATSNVAVLIRGDLAKIYGGRQITFSINTPEEWCDYYGVPVENGVAILFKGLDSKFTAQWNDFKYTPGTTPVAPDWDGGNRECGGGLHFSPHPQMTREFAQNAVKFVACPVALSDISVRPNGYYPQKVKARGCCAPVYEVDINGCRIDDKGTTK